MVQQSVQLVRVRTRLLALGVMVLGLLAGSLVAPTGARSAAVEVGYRDFSYSTSITAPTGQKPESKLWYADGTWWGALWNGSVSPRRLEIYRFNQATQATNAWTATGTTIDSRRNSEADTLWDGSKLYVLTHMKDTDTSATDLGLKFQRFGYSTSTKKYTLEASKTVVNKKAEAAVMDKDSTGKLWVTYTTENTSGGREVRVAHSTTSDTTWTAPYVLPATGANNLSLDDISTLVAYRDSKTGTRRIGVLWSNESAGTANGLYFASHVDGTGDTSASWAGTRLCATTLCPDDHLNIKSIDADASGNLYAAVKTSKNDASSPNPADPLIVVYRLNLDGTWTHTTAWTGQGRRHPRHHPARRHQPRGPPLRRRPLLQRWHRLHQEGLPGHPRLPHRPGHPLHQELPGPEDQQPHLHQADRQLHHRPARPGRRRQHPLLRPQLPADRHCQRRHRHPDHHRRHLCQQRVTDDGVGVRHHHVGGWQPHQQRLPEVQPDPVRRQDDHRRDADGADDGEHLEWLGWARPPSGRSATTAGRRAR